MMLTITVECLLQSNAKTKVKKKMKKPLQQDDGMISVLFCFKRNCKDSFQYFLYAASIIKSSLSSSKCPLIEITQSNNHQQNLFQLSWRIQISVYIVVRLYGLGYWF